MATVIIPPKTLVPGEPIIFLAGPIQGADDWQDKAIGLLKDAKGVIVASPRRPIARDSREFTEDMYNEQVDWEHEWLSNAATRGVILFWLAKEAVHDCGRAYAQTTRFELGEAVTVHRLSETYGYKLVRVVVGIEDGYTGARYVRRTLSKKAPQIPIFATLEETCKRALNIALSV